MKPYPPFRPLYLFLLLGVSCSSAEKADDGETAGNDTGVQCDDADRSVGYRDQDGDGYGSSDERITPCGPLPDGYVENDDDCDDSEENGPAVYPGADELCDGLDNDCDFEFDEDATDTKTFYRDADTDGFGDAADTISACNCPDGYVLWVGDCDDDPDNGAATYPGATEICDGLDNDCDDEIDEDVLDAPGWYPDADGDGHGTSDVESIIYACLAPEGTTGSPSDCDDSNATVHLGAAELCDGIDNDCDTQVDELDECEDTGSPD